MTVVRTDTAIEKDRYKSIKKGILVALAGQRSLNLVTFVGTLSWWPLQLLSIHS